MPLSLKTGLKLLALTSLALGTACATTGPSDARHRRPEPVPATAPAANPQDAKFAAFIESFRATAMEAGITRQTYDAAMSGIHRNPSIEGLTQSQPEFVKPIWSYLDTAVSPTRIKDGQARAASYATTLAAIETRFGVPREILVSIWGNETDYGRGLGSFNLFEALATLAYDGQRAQFGRTELLAALRMVQQDHLDPKQMPASWAGAFGQMQMLPSTFLKSAVDGDGDGKRDLWHSAADALASGASEVAGDGWQRGHMWGYEVKLPANFAYELADGDIQKTTADWAKLGVTTYSGGALPASTDTGAILLPAGMRGPAFMIFPNYRVILKYNNATSYALAVLTLADQIAGRPGVQAAWPRDEQPLSHDERVAFQNGLLKLGYNPGKLDGVLGHDTRAALRSWQKAHGRPADGFPTMSALALILTEVKQKGL